MEKEEGGRHGEAGGGGRVEVAVMDSIDLEKLATHLHTLMHREGPEYVADGSQGDRLGVLTLGTVSGILEQWCGHFRDSQSIHEIAKRVKTGRCQKQPG